MNQYLRTSTRLFKKYWLTRSISIITLTIGFLLLLVAISLRRHEVNFNNKFSDHKTIFRIETTLRFLGGDDQALSNTLAFIGPEAKGALSFIKEQTRLKQSRSNVYYQQKRFPNQEITAADLSYFHVFDFDAIKGDIKSFGQNSVVISNTTSKRLFGGENPIDRDIKVNGETFKVIAVVESLNTDLDFEYLIPLNNDIYDYEWITTYIKTNEEVDTEYLRTQILGASEGKLAGQYNDDVIEIELELASLSEIRFSDKLFGSPKSNMAFLNALSITAIIMMFLSCFNVLNLESSISIKRQKEIYMKKVLGSSKKHLFMQSVFDNLLSFIISLPLALLSFAFLLPYLNQEWNYGLSIEYLLNTYLLVSILAIFLFYLIIISLLQYFFHFSKLRTTSTNKISNKTFGSVKTFILPAQIFICSLVIAFNVLSARQLNSLKSRDIGMNMNNIYVVDFSGSDNQTDLRALKNKINTKLGFKVSMLSSSSIPGNDPEIQLFNLNDNEADQEFVAKHLFVDHNFFELLSIKGDISETYQNSGFIINKSLTKNHQVDLVNKKNYLNYTTILGAVEDYYHRGLFYEITPSVYEYDESKFNSLLVSAQNQMTLKEFENSISALLDDNNYPVYSSLNNLYYAKQESDFNLLQIVNYCNQIILLITIIGILSSSNMLFNFLIKNIAIRRILGAKDTDLITTSIMSLSKGVLISFSLGIGMSYWLYSIWKARYVIQVSIKPLDFLYLFIFLIFVFVILMLTLKSRLSKLDSVHQIKYD